MYGDSQTKVQPVEGASAELPVGHFTAIMAPSRSGKSRRRECSAGVDTLTGGKAFTGVDLDVLDDNRLTILVPAGHPVDILPDVSNPRPSMAH